HPERAYALKTLGNLGQVQFARCDLARPDSVKRVLAGADAVVNLVGAFAGKLDAIQGSGLGAIAGAALEAGASAFVQVSSLNADAGSQVAYARTKAEGEAAVLAAFPEATILRPSIIFGQYDGFVNRFAQLVAGLPVVPVFVPGAQLQPVFVDDVAEAVAITLADPETHGGKTYELAGPETVSMQAVMERIATACGRDPLLLPVCNLGAGLFAALPGTPLSTDQLHLLKAGSLATGSLPGLAELGITARPMELFLDRWLMRYREHGRFGVKRAA
ncbi:MAG TPA: complex I NDUFA9 subunit family protein, partial [Novosphingobium sp.]|nr:complex I NDUFA9 subunit family protein [Novosphingobium sp.]